MKKTIQNFLATGLAVIGGFLYSSHIHGQITGPNYPSSVSDKTGSGGKRYAWTNPMNAEALDNKYAFDSIPVYTLGPNGSNYSDSLKALGFGFAIQNDAIIQGVTVQVIGHCKLYGTAGVSGYINMVKHNVILDYRTSALQKAIPLQQWPTTSTTDDTVSTGNTCDSLWGVNWLPADINDPTFGASFYVAGNKATVYINAIRITVCYRTPSGIATMTRTSGAGLLFPNPSTGMVYAGVMGKYELMVYDVCGKEAYHSFLEDPQHVDLSFLSNGLYVVKLAGINVSNTQKLLIQK